MNRILALGLLVLTSCATTAYVPKNRRFVTASLGTNQIELGRCDQRTRLDPFFSGVDDIFPDDSRSRVLAKKARRHQTTSAALAIAGTTVGLIGSILLVVDQAESGTNELGGAGVAGATMIGSGLAVTLASGPLQLRARSELLDAVNIHNDEVADLTDEEACAR